MRKRVLLDVDGVVCDLVSPTVACLNQLLTQKKVCTIGNIDRWNIAEAMAVYCGEKENSDLAMSLNRTLNYLFNTESFVANLPVYYDSREAVERMAAVADVYFVTAGRDQSRYWHYERFQWLTKHFGGLFQDVIFANHKHIVEGNFFLDDKPSNVLTRMEIGSSGESYLMDRPWNRSCVDCAKVSALDFAQIVEASC
jgi:5'(3')-deoxyribonucleotidase